MRAVLFALGVLFVIPSARAAESEERPPIFAPRPAVTEKAAPAPRQPAARAGTSDRMRILLTERILEDAKAFEAPPPAAPYESAASTLTPEGALLMRRFVVRSLPPRRNEVEPPPVALLDFVPAVRTDRRVNGYSATLLSLFEGKAFINFNVVNGAGAGVDNRREFTRFEIEFSLLPAARK